MDFWTEVLKEADGRKIVVDLYTCQGGAARGYQLADCYVIGVDREPQPRNCSDRFVQADAVQWLLYSATQRIQGNTHPDLIGPTRDAMMRARVPGVIENVEDAGPELESPVMLCGADFGLHTYRHRLFEAIGWTMTAPAHRSHEHRTVKMGRPVREGDWYHAVGNFSGVGYIRRDLNVPWMNRDGMRECIPPVYSLHVAEQFLARAGQLELF